MSREGDPKERPGSGGVESRTFRVGRSESRTRPRVDTKGGPPSRVGPQKERRREGHHPAPVLKSVSGQRVAQEWGPTVPGTNRVVTKTECPPRISCRQLVLSLQDEVGLTGEVYSFRSREDPRQEVLDLSPLRSRPAFTERDRNQDWSEGSDISVQTESRDRVG